MREVVDLFEVLADLCYHKLKQTRLKRFGRRKQNMPVARNILDMQWVIVEDEQDIITFSLRR